AARPVRVLVAQTDASLGPGAHRHKSCGALRSANDCTRSSTSRRLNSCLLIDTAVMARSPGPQEPEECRLYFAEGCHLYMAPTFRRRRMDVVVSRGSPLVARLSTGEGLRKRVGHQRRGRMEKQAIRLWHRAREFDRQT